MPHLQQSLVTLRIWGDDLVPDTISALLGGTPTFAHVKGEPLTGVPSDHVRVAKTGSWHLRAPDAEPEDIDAQVRELLAGLTSDLAVWRGLRERYGIDLFCGLFMGHGNESLSISPPTLVALGVRGIELALDIYAPRLEAAAEAVDASAEVPVAAPLPPVVPPRRRRARSEAPVADLLAGLDPPD